MKENSTLPRAPEPVPDHQMQFCFIPKKLVSLVYKKINFYKRCAESTHIHNEKLSGKSGGARGVMVIIVRNGHGETSSNPGRDWLHFT